MPIDLSQLPAPQVVEALDFEVILSSRKAALLALWPEADRPALEATLALESEALTRFLQESAYRELLLRARINEAAQATMLAYAAGTDLDQRGANVDVFRLLIQAGDPDAIPPIPDVWESDEDFRARIQLSPSQYSVAGPQDAYVFHALSADGRVKHVRAESPTPGHVVVSVLARDGDGTPPADLLAAVAARLSDKAVRPLTDAVTVRAATIVSFSISATLHFYSGPDAALVMSSAEEALADYLDSVRKIGADITRSGIFAALHRPGVQRVVLADPAADIAIDAQSAGYCTAVTLTNGGTDE